MNRLIACLLVFGCFTPLAHAESPAEDTAADQEFDRSILLKYEAKIKQLNRYTVTYEEKSSKAGKAQSNNGKDSDGLQVTLIRKGKS